MIDHYKLQKTISSIIGMECWKVYAGGSAGSSFSLELGERVLAEKPLSKIKAQALVDKYGIELSEFEGEASFIVWCSWRLDGLDKPLTSSDQKANEIAEALEALIGNKVSSINVQPPAWDLHLTFSLDLQLNVFCDHIPGDPSFHGNWDLRLGNKWISTGPGYKIEFEGS